MIGVAGAAGDELHVRVDDARLLGDVARLAAVLARLQAPHLPGAVHLVAQAPVLHLVRLLVSMRATQIAPLRALGVVAVLDVGHGHFRGAGAEVEAQQRLGAHGLGPVHEIVGAELVGLELIPGALENRRAVLLRADAIPPVVARDEVAAGVTHDGDLQVLHFTQRIGAEATLVGQRRPGLVHAGVHRAAQVFEERAEQATVEVGARRDQAQRHPGGAIRGLREARHRERGGGGNAGTGESGLFEKATARRAIHWFCPLVWRKRV